MVGLRDVEFALFHKISYLQFLINNRDNKDKWFDIMLVTDLKFDENNSVINNLKGFVEREKLDFIKDIEKANPEVNRT